MSLVDEHRLRRLVPEAMGLDLEPRARQKTPRPGEVIAPFASQSKTSDIQGIRGYMPGDSMSMVRWRDLLLQGQLNVRDYRLAIPPDVNVLLDGSPGLIGNQFVGRFAIELAFSLCVASAAKMFDTKFAVLGESLSRSLKGRKRIASFVDRFAALEIAAPANGDELSQLLARSLPRPSANCTVYLIASVGRPLVAFESLMRANAACGRHLVLLLPIPIGEFQDCPSGWARRPADGRAVPCPKNVSRHLSEFLDALVRLGLKFRCGVEPLLVSDPAADLLAVFAFLQ